MKTAGGNLPETGNGSYFCVFCEIGSEAVVEISLENKGCTVISSLVERYIVKNKKFNKELRPILSGYVFFEYYGLPNWIEIKRMNHILYPLKYSDNTRSLRGNDEKFVHWLIQNKGVIKMSKAIEIGHKIKIIKGPLKDYEGNIVKVNKREKSVKIEINGEGIIKYVWLSYEYI
jgi:transcription antitermination factor NusG